MQEHSSDLTNVIIDNGSYQIKAGISDNENISHSLLRVQRDGDIISRNESEKMSENLDLNYPIRNGVVNDWDSIEKVWQYCFTNLNLNPSNCRVLLTEAAAYELSNIDKMIEIDV